jgi:eukaryotic-like serine/threonine-protein kinase
VQRRWVVLAAAAALVVLAVVAAVLVARRDSERETTGNVVPSVVGLAQAEAESRLVDGGYSTQIVRTRAAQRAGTVVRQQPSGGAQAAPGTIVELTVASGAAPGVAPTETQAEGSAIEVPRAIGRHQILAGADLERLGLVVDTYPVAARAACGTVVAQKPAPGTRVARGTTIRLSVSLGVNPHPVTQVPGLLGEPSESRQAAREFGFTVRTETRRAPRPDARSQVFEQRPGALTKARELSQVTIVVGS